MTSRSQFHGDAPARPRRPGARAVPAVIRGLALTLVLALVVGCTGSGGATAGGGSTTGCPTSQPAPLTTTDTRTVTITTSKGTIAIKVEGKLSPIATGNFVALAACHFYDGVVFHRVVPKFVIQGGDGQYGRKASLDRARLGQGGPGYGIQDEPVTTQYHRGTVAMARSSQPNSQGSQFFIVLDDSAAASLAAANTYAILGTVTSGMDTADAIAAAADAEIPSDPIAMETVTVSNP